jgi:hypothetical protein
MELAAARARLHLGEINRPVHTDQGHGAHVTDDPVVLDGLIRHRVSFRNGAINSKPKMVAYFKHRNRQQTIVSNSRVPLEEAVTGRNNTSRSAGPTVNVGRAL